MIYAKRCELRFIYDKLTDQGSNIEDILRSVNKGSDDEQEGPLKIFTVLLFLITKRVELAKGCNQN